MNSSGTYCQTLLGSAYGRENLGSIVCPQTRAQKITRGSQGLACGKYVSRWRPSGPLAVVKHLTTGLEKKNSLMCSLRGTSTSPAKLGLQEPNQIAQLRAAMLANVPLRLTIQDCSEHACLPEVEARLCCWHRSVT